MSGRPLSELRPPVTPWSTPGHRETPRSASRYEWPREGGRSRAAHLRALGCTLPPHHLSRLSAEGLRPRRGAPGQRAPPLPSLSDEALAETGEALPFPRPPAHDGHPAPPLRRAFGGRPEVAPAPGPEAHGGHVWTPRHGRDAATAGGLRTYDPGVTHERRNAEGAGAAEWIPQRLRPLQRVGETGFEPATPWSRTKCSTRLSHSPRPTPLLRGTHSVTDGHPGGQPSEGSRLTAHGPTPTAEVTHAPQSQPRATSGGKRRCGFCDPP